MKALFQPFYVLIVTKSIIMIIAIWLLLMTRRGSDEYHPKLFLDDTINGDSNIGENVFRQLETVAAQKIADIDYELQIERWNQYQALLDKIEKKCSRQAGVKIG